MHTGLSLIPRIMPFDPYFSILTPKCVKLAFLVSINKWSHDLYLENLKTCSELCYTHTPARCQLQLMFQVVC